MLVVKSLVRQIVIIMADPIKDLLLTSGVIDKLSQNHSKYGRVTESKSIFTVFDQRMFFWHDAGSSVLTVEIRPSDSAKISICQVLMLTNPPVFEVECLIFNRTGTLLTLVGQDGVMVVEVPQRYRTLTSSRESDKSYFCRSWNVAERFFVCTNRVKVVQVAWHPGSPYNTHLTILSSDNCIRVYDVTDAQTPQTVVSLAPSSKCFYLSSNSKASVSACLGESAVSFDFGPPENACSPKCAKFNEEQHSDHCQWRIFVLYGNGDIYAVQLPVKKTSSEQVKVEGPLAMYPQSDDNYGVDACSLICLPSAVPVLVIATASGMLYHCMVLATIVSDDDSKDEESWSAYNQSYNETAADVALYVYESVELSSSLISEDSEDVYSRPIRLHKDPTMCSKYHCTHLSGVHSVALPFVHFLEEYADTDDLEVLLPQLEGEKCIVEHLLCTQPLSAVDAIPVLGLSVIVTEKGAALICLLASWEFTCVPLASSYLTSAPSLLSSNIKISDSSALEEQGVSFEKHIQSLLHRSVSTPLLKSSLSSEECKTSPHQWLDLLCSLTQRLREDYIQRLLAVQTQIECRRKILAQLKQQQTLEIEKCLREKDVLRNTAEQLAEKYDDAQTKQHALLGRIEKVLQLLHNKLPVLSDAELNMKQELATCEEKLKLYQSSLDQIKMKQNYQSEKTQDLESSSHTNVSAVKRQENTSISGNQLKHLKEILATEGQSISDLVKMVCTLKKEAGL